MASQVSNAIHSLTSFVYGWENGGYEISIKALKDMEMRESEL